MEISCCGLCCANCERYSHLCSGCLSSEGSPYWVEKTGLLYCHIYFCCAINKNLDNCGQCRDFPCSLFFPANNAKSVIGEYSKIMSRRCKNLRLY